ncbi:MAG: SPFH domain-containing protein [Patescibacteria group bacterium]
MIGIIVGIIFFGICAFFLQGLRRVPADPPHKGVRTIWGERTTEKIDEGWNFFPIYPYWHGVVLVDMTKKNQDLLPNEIRTAEDMAEIEVAISLTWKPDEKNLIEYLNSGGESGIKNILKDIVEEAVREFAADTSRKPNTWEDAITMKKEFLAEIVAVILGKNPPISEDEINKIVLELRRGNGKLQLETLGVILNRVNVTSIKPKGKLAEAAQKEAIEKREKKAETVELNHLAERIEALKKLGFSNEQALEIVQTERGKISKTISESKWNVSPETRAMIEKIGLDLVAKILGR